MRINANGISMNTQIDGPESAPWLVFSNSLMTNLSMWDDQVAELKKSFRILRYDQRGHGGTQTTEGPYSFDLLVADTIALIDALSIKRAHFAGLSMGGMTALYLAQRHPQRFDRIIACDCGPASTPASAQQWKERIELAARDGMGALVESTVGRWFPPETVAKNPPHLAKVRQMIRATPVNGFIGCSAALADHNYNAKVETVTRPVLFMVGEKDGTAPAAMKAMHARLKGSRYVELPGAGHISNMDRPAEFTRAVEEFLA